MKSNKSLFITTSDFKPEFSLEQHVHSNFTDGLNTLEEIIKSAIKKNVKRIAFTEHVQRGSDWYIDFVNQVNKFKIKYLDDIEIVIGLEAKMINKQGDIDASIEQKSYAEIIIGSVHGYLKEKECEFYDINAINSQTALKKEFDHTVAMIDNSHRSGINVIGHPFGIFIKRYNQKVPKSYWQEIIIKITNKKIAFDLNYLYHKNYFNVILELCDKHNTKINIGSDAHSLENIGKCFALVNKYIKYERKKI